jgi:hypothetical protein
MAITSFDTHKFVRRLEEAGVPLKQAEVQAEVLTEAFNVNLEALVTKDFLAARFAEQNAYIETRFLEQDARWEKRIAELDIRWEKRFAELDIRWEKRFAQQEGKVDSNQRVFVWTQAIVMAAVILPYLERLMAL